MAKTILVKMLEDYTVDNRIVKAGKQGSFEEQVASKMIKEGAAEEIIVVTGVSELFQTVRHAPRKPSTQDVSDKKEPDVQDEKPSPEKVDKVPATKEEKSFK